MRRVVASSCVSFVFLKPSPQDPSEKPGARVPALVHTGPNGKIRKPKGLSASLFEERVEDGEGKAWAGRRRAWVLSSSIPQCLWDKI